MSCPPVAPPPVYWTCRGTRTGRAWRPGRRGARRASPRLQEAPGEPSQRWQVELGASQRARRLYKAAAVAQRLHARLPAPARQALGTSPLIRSARPSAPAMASIQQLVGRWRLVESKGFDEYMKEVGVGMALRKMGAMAKPDCIITFDGKDLTIKTESTLKTTQFSCNLGQKFEETTADGRKTQTVCDFTNGELVQHQEWDGKESTITRKVENGKLVVVCVMNNVTCTRVYEKVE
uniref:Fatty acid binding protein 5 n=2 Tax=Sus scrofa TaxID=9823 RepID=A0A8D1Y2I6_PIG